MFTPREGRIADALLSGSDDKQICRTDLQQGLMALTRAVAQPPFF